MVKIAAVLSLLAPALFVLVGLLALFPFGLVPAGLFVWFSLWLRSRLRGTAVKKGLALAVGTGSATILFALALAASVATHGFEDKVGDEDWGWVVLLVLPVLAPAILLVVSAIKAYYTTKPELGDASALRRGLGWGVAYFLIIFLPLVGVGRSTFP